MKKIVYLILIFASCNTKTKDVSESTGAENKSQMPEASSLISPGCYQMVIDKDTAMMDLSVNGKTVSGSLEYKRYEKDSNKGSFSGSIDSNKIIAWYKFQSEGMVSVRQVIFKITGNQFAEGYGDLDVKGDTAFFKYPHQLNYEENHPFIKAGCK